MKAKKLVAIVMGTAIAATMAASVAACSKRKEPEAPQSLGTTTDFKISDYAAKWEDSNAKQKSVKGLTTAKTLFSGKTVAGTLLSQTCVILAETKTVDQAEVTTYSVYSLTHEKEILKDLKVMPTTENLGYGSGWTVIKVTSDEDPSEYAYYAPDGTAIVGMGTYQLYAYRQTGCYVSGADKTSTVYAVSGSKITYEEGNFIPDIEEVELYFNTVVDKDTGVTTYAKVDVSAIKAYPSDYNKGEDWSGIKSKLYEEDEDCPVDGEIKNYEVSVFGNKYTFYKGSDVTGTVDLTANGRALGMLGNSFYYSVATPVVETVDGLDYNVVSLSEATENKSKYQLYKYDVVENTTTELNYDVVIGSISAKYNYTTKAYDGAIIYGYKMVDGVCVGGYNNFTYVVDKDLNVAYDITDTPIQANADIYDLGNDKYYVGYSYGTGYIVDGDVNPVNAEVSLSNVYLDQSLIVNSYYNGENYTYFTDYSGKIVIAPEYSTQGSYKFYGDIAHVYGVDGELLIKKDGTVVTNLTKLEETDDENVFKMVDVEDGYYTVNTQTYDEDTDETTVEYAFYAFDGTLLKKFDHTNVTTRTVGNSTILVEMVEVEDGNTTTYTYNYYKLG